MFSVDINVIMLSRAAIRTSLRMHVRSMTMRNVVLIRRLPQGRAIVPADRTCGSEERRVCHVQGDLCDARSST